MDSTMKNTVTSPEKKRCHSDLIIAWANGADIQCNCAGTWKDVETPTWNVDVEYRVKPVYPMPKLNWDVDKLTQEYHSHFDTPLFKMEHLANYIVAQFITSGEMDKWLAEREKFNAAI